MVIKYTRNNQVNVLYLTMTSTTNKIDKNWNREDGLGSRSITELFVPLSLSCFTLLI